MKQGSAVVVPLHRGGVERIGEAIRRVRRERGLSQCELAARLGRPQSTVSQLENGKVAANLDRLASVEAALDLPRGYLAIEAGYVTSSEGHLDRPQVDVPVEGIAAYVVRWMAEFSELITAIELLEGAGEPEAVEALRQVQPVRVLRASVDLWACLHPEDEGLGRLDRYLAGPTVDSMVRAVWADEPSPLIACDPVS